MFQCESEKRWNKTKYTVCVLIILIILIILCNLDHSIYMKSEKYVDYWLSNSLRSC